MLDALWQSCLQRFQHEIPEQQYNTWIKPLRVTETDDIRVLYLQAPNRFIKDWVDVQFSKRITELIQELSAGQLKRISLTFDTSGGIGKNINATTENTDVALAMDLSSAAAPQPNQRAQYNAMLNQQSAATQNAQQESVLAYASNGRRSNVLYSTSPAEKLAIEKQELAATLAFSKPVFGNNVSVLGHSESIHQQNSNKAKIRENQPKSVGLISNYLFENFVEGKSNQLAYAAAQQVAENPGSAYNPLFLYGGVGLGKTHLMHGIGNALYKKNPNARVVYLHSERFVADMVKALQLNAINDFKRYYRSVDALLIDDIQFFAGKDHSQEEFFHTFNALLEGGQQIILTSDRYPKEINGLEERLRSRFGWGLTVEVQPPELETRVAILLKKAQETNMNLNSDVAFFIAQRIRANVRDLEGALKRIKAHASFVNKPINIDLVQEALRDLFSLQDRLVNINNIQKIVAEYYKIKRADLLSKRRSRSIARPRQMAMALAKELTNHSLPEIGDSFGGRDHTTVLHACRKIAELRESNSDVREDHKNLLRLLTT